MGDDMTTRVFVYGSLMRGQGNHRHLERSSFVCAARTQPLYRMHSLGAFPGVVARGAQAIEGEVFDVDAATLDRLDSLEGHPTFYRRTLITLDDKSIVSMYLLQRTDLKRYPIVASGSWLQHQKEQHQ
jgi:gamma-glutamylaminecyclotransferase